MLKRDLKQQMQADVKKVFLNLNGFAELETLRYFRNGNSAPPDEFHVPVVIVEDKNMNSVWNKNKAQQRAGNEPVLYQMDFSLWVAMEDFQPAPKKNRRIIVGDRSYNVLDVDTQEGFFRIEIRRLEE